MLSESLIVVAVSEDQTSAEVSGSRRAACNACPAKLGCGHGMLSKSKSSQTFTLPLSEQRLDIAVGDLVQLIMPANALLLLTFRAYLQPLLLVMVLVTTVSVFAPSQTGLHILALLVSLGFSAIWSLSQASVQQEVASLLEISKCSHSKK